MTYNLLLAGELDQSGLAAALASLISVPIDVVDVGHADDSDNRNWDALVSCTYEQTFGDITWMLDVYLADEIAKRPSESQAAAHLAGELGTAVLYPAAEALPSAYWLAAPEGMRTRARLESFDTDDRTVYTIAAVEKPVPSLPMVPVDPQPEVIREHRVPTPITDEVSEWLKTATDAGVEEEAVWLARTRLGAWENLIGRMASGWPPDGWYPAEFYREDLEARDELETAMERLPEMTARRFAVALARLDEDFRTATREADDAESPALSGTDDFDPAARSWFWHRLPEPPPWLKAP